MTEIETEGESNGQGQSPTGNGRYEAASRYPSSRTRTYHGRQLDSDEYSE